VPPAELLGLGVSERTIANKTHCTKFGLKKQRTAAFLKLQTAD
jgi:hypothetical protein